MNGFGKFIPPNVDVLLSRGECAAWFGQSERWLQDNPDKIVPFHPTHKTTVYHPRTILAKLAFDSGVPLEVIAASYGMMEKPNPTKG